MPPLFLLISTKATPPSLHWNTYWMPHLLHYYWWAQRPRLLSWHFKMSMCSHYVYILFPFLHSVLHKHFSSRGKLNSVFPLKQVRTTSNPHKRQKYISAGFQASVLWSTNAIIYYFILIYVHHIQSNWALIFAGVPKLLHRTANTFYGLWSTMVIHSEPKSAGVTSKLNTLLLAITVERNRSRCMRPRLRFNLHSGGRQRDRGRRCVFTLDL